MLFICLSIYFMLKYFCFSQVQKDFESHVRVFLFFIIFTVKLFFLPYLTLYCFMEVHLKIKL
jgi:hypothetical protein